MSDRWRAYLRFWGPNVDADVDDEVDLHVEQRVEWFIAHGLSPNDARLTALNEFGDVDAVKRALRQHDRRALRKKRRVHMLQDIVQDFRFAARGLVRQKAWTSIAVVTLALGIGANSTMFTIVNAVLLRPLPYPHADRVVSLSTAAKGIDGEVAPSDEYRAWAASSRQLSAIGVYSPDQLVDTRGDVPVVIPGAAVTASYFGVLAVAPAMGRVFDAHEDVPGGPPLIVLSDALWRTRFGADPAIVGKTVAIGDHQKTVIGVMPARFRTSPASEYWVPAGLHGSDRPGVTFYYFVFARLRDGATVASARAELAAISARVVAARQTIGPPTASTPVVMTLHDRLYGSVQPALLILLGAVGVLLLIACANVSNLLLARATHRRREFAIRRALGAGRWRVVRYLLCESLALSVVGAALGLLVPWLALGAIVRAGPAAIAKTSDVHVDPTVLGATALVALLTSIVFGLVPAFGAGRVDITRSLAGGQRTTPTGREKLLRELLVVAELATALVLLTGAGLLTRSFVRAVTVDPGFRATGLVTMRLSLPRARYTQQRVNEFYSRVLTQARALPGVRAAAVGDALPLEGVMMTSTGPDAAGHPITYDNAVVGPGYFDAIGLAIRRGRAFNTGDVTSPLVCVISESLARLAFPGVSPIGQSLGVGANAARVVGVVGDVHQRGLEEPTRPMAYWPAGDTGLTVIGNFASLVLRVDGPTTAMPSALRAIVRNVDPRLVPPQVRTADEIIAAAAAPRKFDSLVLGVFALLAAGLAAIGLYGVLGYVVSDRTHEIGIRIALGADRGRVLRLVMTQGLRVTAVGVALGLTGSLVAVRLLRSMLFALDVYDPTTFVSAAALMCGVALLACYVPSRRATRVDPVVALRSE